MRNIKTFIPFFIFLFSSLNIKAQSSLSDSIFHPDSIRHIIEILASDSLKGRFTGTLENYKAAEFIAKEFGNAGLKPVSGNNGFFQEIKPAWNNVIGAINGRSKAGQIILFSAHYDHVGTISTNPYLGLTTDNKYDTIFNGANDNASGVAAVICLAKYFGVLSNNERTLLFVAFTGEELGLIGSRYLANDIVEDSIIAVINIEMIGRTSSGKLNPFITGAQLTNLIEILNMNYQQKSNKAEKGFFKKESNSRPLFDRSDNYSFAVKGGPAHSIMLTSDNDKYYHTVDDEPRTLDFKVIKKIIDAIAVSTTGLIKGVDTPKRIKVSY